MSVTNERLSFLAARIAREASAWACDMMIRGAGPVSEGTVRRFLADVGTYIEVLKIEAGLDETKPK